MEKVVVVVVGAAAVVMVVVVVAVREGATRARTSSTAWDRMRGDCSWSSATKTGRGC